MANAATARGGALAVCGLLLASSACTREPEPVAPPPAALAARAPAPADAGPPDEPEREAVVAAAVGRVERLREGGWTPVQVGDRVRTEDAIRTGAKAKADLQIGPEATLTVDADTQVDVAELTDAVHRFKLKRGRVAAAYESEGARVLRIEGERGEVVEAAAAKVSVLATGNAFAVATETGKVNLKAGGSTVTVAAGEQAVATGGEAPSAVAPIPVAVLLKVAAASRVGSPEPCEFDGTAAPGSQVLVEGEPVEVDPKGRFRVPAAGRTRVRIVMRDVAGRVTEELVRCPPTRPKSIDEVKVKWGE